MTTRIDQYNKIREILTTGSIVLFTGSGIVSNIIRLSGERTHVGMVVLLPQYDSVCLMESTTLSTLKDLDSGKYRKGVQLVSLSDRIATYDGDIAVRRLNMETGLNSFSPELMAFRREINGRGYEENVKDLIGSAFDIFSDKKEDLSTLFCSELVAEAYQRMGLLPNDVPSDSYTPTDFSEKKWLKLLYGNLGGEIVL